MKRYVPLFEEFVYKLNNGKTRKGRKINEGYSNNSDYVGDWFGDGQIDFNAVINPDDEGDYYMIKMWCGSGYALDVYIVKATNTYDAMDVAFKWSYENEGKNNIVFDYDYIHKEAQEYFKADNGQLGRGDYSDNFEEYENNWFDQNYIAAECGLYARDENFFVGKIPDDVIAKHINK